jgi:hypothetical protein
MLNNVREIILKHIIPWNGAAIAIQLLTYFSNTYRKKQHYSEKEL